jgi:uncharacterized protein (DUF1800 family)
MNKAISTSIATVLVIAGIVGLAGESQSKSIGVNSASSTTALLPPGQISEDERILHLLNRISFGPTVEDIETVKQVGIEHFIQEQLDPRSIAQNPELNQLVADSKAISGAPADLIMSYSRQAMVDQAKQQGITDKETLKKEIGQKYKALQQQLLLTKLRRNAESPRQLEEVMTDFWFNHFNISINKGPFGRFLVGSFEQQAIRPNALGNFRDLLEATARHPAMLFYLDNWENTDPNSPGAKGRFKGINENYARELMELHTLGVDGGYTQQDVVALAHILTGLGFANPRQLAAGRVKVDEFGCYFDANRHDFSDKQFLGHTIKGTGATEVEQALDILASQPATAHHLSYQLAQYFVSDTPPEALVNRLSQTYMRTGGSIKAVMNDLLHSPEFWDSKAIAAKYKSPYHYAISVVRASGASLNNYQRVAQFSRLLGEPVYGCLTPDGYKNTQEAWLNPDGLLKRITFAGNVAKGAFGPLPNNEVERIQEAIGPRLSQNTITALANTQDTQRAGLLLGSPEFMTY